MSELTLLQGLRVVSLEQFIAGPYCTSLLADAGAEVTKIERPGVGDPRRSYEPKVGDGEDAISGGFASYNRGKRSVELALDTPEGVAELAGMLADADVLVCNLRPGALARMGLAPVALRERFPRLVVCEITGFGSTGGEAANWPAFDSVIQGMSGFASLVGEADGPPTLTPMGTTDMLTAVYSTIGILMAIIQRERTGEGSLVDAAMLDITAAFLERPLTLHEFTGAVPTRGIDRFSPVGMFRAGDGRWLSIVIPTDEMWRRCADAMGRPQMITDPELDTVLKRADRMHDRVIPAFEAWAAGLTQEEAAHALRVAGQPVGLVQDIGEVRANPHLAHRELFVPMVDEVAMRADGSRISLPRLPLLFDGEHATPGPVPRLGEHNPPDGHGSSEQVAE
ncbi:CoA transferase [Leucobacter rhizosphaerae]|uniref:CoA transferase n=1 Tax=Leucobacter rhizosphaerae TaxID=2932245 RepID=A0ABY4FTS9_9MICO|nr:CoA transferase [Leucobacter rhizosphaerae]UOQ59662.1 CoA transferase [Leucobacter rhizosphaerae]